MLLGQGVKGKYLKECEKYVMSHDLWVTVRPLNDSRSIGLTQFNNQFRDVRWILGYILRENKIEKMCLDNDTKKWEKLNINTTKDG